MPYRKRSPSKRRFFLFIPLLLILVLLISFWPRQSPPPAAEPEPGGEAVLGPQIAILNREGQAETVYLEEFLVGVVAAEMPASFAPAALQAQAIAARSYIMRQTAPYGIPRHAEAAVCLDSTHCQAYLTPAEHLARWGEEGEANLAKIQAAVQETAGVVLFYDGTVAETPYCSTCGGSTEAAVDCWGQEVAYLQARVCRWDSHSPKYLASTSFSLQSAAQALGVTTAALPTMTVQGLSAGQRVKSLQIGEQTWSGREVREKLALNSAAFRWLINGEQIIFQNQGYGHGVGLCQYGADGMASAGYNAYQIVDYYYRGTELTRVY